MVSILIMSWLAVISMPHTSMAAALDAVTLEIAKDSPYEWCGAILNKDGFFFYTVPKTNRSSMTCHVEVNAPLDYRFVAVYHSHPRPRFQQNLRTLREYSDPSPLDKKIARSIDLKSYLIRPWAIAAVQEIR